MRGHAPLRRHKIALAARSPDQFPGRGIFQLAAEIVHIDIHDVRGLNGLEIPNGLQQLNARDALAAIQHQVLEQRELFVGKIDCRAAAPRRMVQPIQLEIAGAQVQPRLSLAPQQRPATRAQLVQAERLQHHVVRAMIEAAHPRVHLLPPSQYQDRQIGFQIVNLP